MFYLILCLSFPSIGINESVIPVKEKVRPENVILMPRTPFELKLPKQWVTLLEEHFESGIPGNWQVLNWNGDGYSWLTGTTSGFFGFDPPDYGLAYAYYSDDDAGSSAPASQPGEDIITPAVYTVGYDTIKVIFAYGNSYTWQADDIFGVWVRVFTGGIWSSWENKENYPNATSGYDTLVYVSSKALIDSIQVMWRYSDNSGWNWACGIDNVYIIGHSLPPAGHDVGTISISSFPNFYNLNTYYNLTATFKNFGLNPETFNAYYNTYDEFGNQVHTAGVNGLVLNPGDTIRFAFVSGSTENYKKLLLKAFTYLSIDERRWNDTLKKWIYADIDGRSFGGPTPTPPINAKRGVPYDIYEHFANDGIVGDTFDITLNITLNGNLIFSDQLLDFYIGGVTGHYHHWGQVTFPQDGNYTLTQIITSPYDIRNGNDTLIINGVVNNWEFFTNMPQRLMDHNVVSDGSKLYVFGGYFGTSFANLYIYDFNTKLWSNGANLPRDLCMGDACRVGDTIYFPGGYSYSFGGIIDSLYKYSITGNNWTVSQGTGEPVWFYTCKPANGKVYKIGGLNNVSGIMYASTWEYNPSTGLWTKKADMPFPCELMLSDVKNDTIYLIGGYDGFNIRNETRFYDAINNTWTMNNSIFSYYPIGIWGGGCAFFNDTLFGICGVNIYWQITDSVFYYDKASNIWVYDGSVIRKVYRTDAVGKNSTKGIEGIYLVGGSVSGFNPIDSIFARKPVLTGIPEKPEVSVYFISRIGKEVKFVINGSGKYDLSIFDVTGRNVKRINDVSGGVPITISAREIKKGVYFIKVEGIEKAFKIILIK